MIIPINVANGITIREIAQEVPTPCTMDEYPSLSTKNKQSTQAGKASNNPRATLFGGTLRPNAKPAIENITKSKMLQKSKNKQITLIKASMRPMANNIAAVWDVLLFMQ